MLIDIPLTAIPVKLSPSECPGPHFRKVNSSLPGQNGRHIGRREFHMHFLEWKWQNSDSNFIEICSKESNWLWVSIGSGNGLAPKRRQAITWISADPVHWGNHLVPGDLVVLAISCHVGFEGTHQPECKAWASYQIRKFEGCACAGNTGNIFPVTMG